MEQADTGLGQITIIGEGGIVASTCYKFDMTYSTLNGKNSGFWYNLVVQPEKVVTCGASLMMVEDSEEQTSCQSAVVILPRQVNFRS